MIYLDHNATTPVLPAVFEAMRPCFGEQWGNPSSTSRFGAELKTVIESAWEQVAELIGAHLREIVFTSGDTESSNTAIHAALAANSGKRHIVTSQVEHSSVLSDPKPVSNLLHARRNNPCLCLDVWQPRKPLHRKFG